MKRILVLSLAIAVMCVSAFANNAYVADDFENGISEFGIAYSGRQDTEMPMIFSTTAVCADGSRSMEIVPIGSLPYNDGTVVSGNKFPYQGVYLKDYQHVKASVTYSANVDVYAESDGAKARFVLMDGNKAIAVSDEYDVLTNRWGNIECKWTAERDSSKIKVIIAFYTDDTNGYTDKLYIDNFEFKSMPGGMDGWRAANGALTIDADVLKYTDTADNLKSYQSIITTINKFEIENGNNVLKAVASSDMPKTYLYVSCDEIPGCYSRYVIDGAGVERNIVLPFDASVSDSSTLTFNIMVSGDATIQGTVSLRGLCIEGSGAVVSAVPLNGNIVFSGDLKKGNEHQTLSVKVDNGTPFSVSTDENGKYTFNASMTDCDVLATEVKAEIGNVYGIPSGKLTTAGLYINHELFENEIALALAQCQTLAEVKGVVTDDDLDTLGISADKIFREANKDYALEFLIGLDNSTYEKFEKNLMAAACINVIDSEKYTLSEIISRYAEKYMNLDDSEIFKKLYKSTNKTELDALFTEFEIKSKDYKDFISRLDMCLIRSAVKKTVNYSEGMKVVKKYATALNLDLSEYKAIEGKSSGVTAGANFISYLKGVTDYSEVQRKLDAIVSEAVNGGAGGNGGNGGNGSNGGTGGASGNTTGWVPITPGNQVPEYTFSDLESVEWAKSSIYTLLNSGVISRSADNKFNPNKNITRAEFVKMVAVILGNTEYSGELVFNDVNKNDWYYKYVMAMYSRGIIKGVSAETFGAEENITREDICVILDRVLNLKESSDKEVFKDSAQISDYAKAAVEKMRNAGYINGYEDNTFRPKSGATRAETAKMLAQIN